MPNFLCALAMPLLTELEQCLMGTRFYNHGAPNGARPGALRTKVLCPARSKAPRLLGIGSRPKRHPSPLTNLFKYRVRRQ